MGSNPSKSTKNVKIGEASEFYWACRTGDYQKAKMIISNLTYDQLNQIEPNGSTALHAATYYNHLKIVELLLQHGCARTTLNRFGYTAFEEAQTDQMRSIFYRPSSQRFMDENPSQSFELSSNSDEHDEMEDDTTNDWVKCHLNKKDAHEANFMDSIARAPVIMRKILQIRLEQESKELLKSFLDDNVKKTDPQYPHVIELFEEFKKNKKIMPLLTLYTAETPVVGALQNDCDSFAALLYLHLPELEDRAYKGLAYRGARMTNDELRAYQWALKQRGRVLETRTFQSMSKNEKVALRFANNKKYEKPISVLLSFYFPEVCRTAIDLTKISDRLLNLSEFPEEEEVTLLPFTLFQVSAINVDATRKNQYRITLTNVPVKNNSI
ncbi:unnamed protein product [Rotaria sp. Silwood1]|nr:unnamed protein product [Rotaria sp. Silwood1]